MLRLSKTSVWAAVALAVGVGLALALHTECRWLHAEWMPALAWLVPAAAVAAWVVRRGAPEAGQAVGEVLPGLMLLGALMLYLFSSAATDVHFYYLEWPPAAGWKAAWVSGLPARTMMLAVAFTAVLLSRRVPLALVLFLVLVGGQLLCAGKLVWHTGGEALYRDDHPSFLFRLWLFARTFPHLVGYNPLWNAGVVGAQAISTGAASIGTLLWPLWRFAPVDAVYTPAVAFVFVFVVPIVAAGSVRLAGGSVVASLCGALLGLGVSQFWFIWLLHFGTTGACFSAAMLPLAAACLFRVLWLDRREWWTGVLLVVGLWAYFSWPAGLVAGSTLALGAAASFRRLTRGKFVFLAACGAAAAVLLLPNVLGLVIHSDPVRFVSEGVEDNTAAAPLMAGWGELAAHLRRGHPLVLFLGLAGVLFLKGGGFVTFFLPVLLGLAALSGWGDLWKPSLQLFRTSIPLLFVAAVPAAVWLGRLFEKGGARMAPARAIALSLLVVGAWNGARFYGNGGEGGYVAMPAQVRELADWLKTNTAEDGRVLFAGPTVHAYGRGHVAYLPVLAGREMMACDFYHFSPKRVEYEYPPRAFRQDDEDVFRFLDLYNVTHVVTYHENWIEFFRRHPEQYEEVFEFGGARRKFVFRVLRKPGWFLRGAGSVRANVNRIDVTVRDPQAECVVKYNWVEGLEAPPPVEISPYDTGEGEVRLIKIRPNGVTYFAIRYTPWL